MLPYLDRYLHCQKCGTIMEEPDHTPHQHICDACHARTVRLDKLYYQQYRRTHRVQMNRVRQRYQATHWIEETARVRWRYWFRKLDAVIALVEGETP